MSIVRKARDRSADPRRRLVLIDDFIFGSTESGEMGELGWGFTNGTFNLVTPEADHPGMAERASGPVMDVVASTYPGGSGTAISFRVDQVEDQTWIVKPKTAGADFIVRIGLLGDMTANPPVNGAYFERLAADTDWYGVTRISNDQTRTAALAAFAVGWFKLRIRRISATSIGFTINDGAEVVLTTTVPLGSNNMVPGFQIVPTTANARSIYLDYVSMVVPQTAR